jgi:phosphotransferase system HPr-like phosphotransfer protein
LNKADTWRMKAKKILENAEEGTLAETSVKEYRGLNTALACACLDRGMIKEVAYLLEEAERGSVEDEGPCLWRNNKNHTGFHWEKRTDLDPDTRTILMRARQKYGRRWKAPALIPSEKTVADLQVRLDSGDEGALKALCDREGHRENEVYLGIVNGRSPPGAASQRAERGSGGVPGPVSPAKREWQRRVAAFLKAHEINGVVHVLDVARSGKALIRPACPEEVEQLRANAFSWLQNPAIADRNHAERDFNIFKPFLVLKKASSSTEQTSARKKTGFNFSRWRYRRAENRINKVIYRGDGINVYPVAQAEVALAADIPLQRPAGEKWWNEYKGVITFDQFGNVYCKFGSTLTYPNHVVLLKGTALGMQHGENMPDWVNVNLLYDRNLKLIRIKIAAGVAPQHRLRRLKNLGGPLSTKEYEALMRREIMRTARMILGVVERQQSRHSLTLEADTDWDLFDLYHVKVHVDFGEDIPVDRITLAGMVKRLSERMASEKTIAERVADIISRKTTRVREAVHSALGRPAVFSSIQDSFLIPWKNGMHARPAGAFVKLSNCLDHELSLDGKIFIGRDREKVSACSIVSIMPASFGPGER